jgi:serine/threonine protein kinase
VSQPLEPPIQFGKYTLYERIGRGGMADVFKGRIQGPGGFERVFVVKRILPHLSDDPTFIKMFVDEAKLSARLNHPNVVQIFELGAVEGEYFISMEYIPGHDLAETTRAIWKKAGPPRVDMVAYVGREICRALSYAHSLTDEQGGLVGMIHRDVSPSNVMLSYEGAVKLLDFGIAKALGDTQDQTNSGSLKGKYAYMAPEQTEGENVDHRIDIFAAGIVMHEVLTGRRLFKGANDLQTIERVRRCEVRPPSQFNQAVPPELDAILLKALARNPDDRYQDASEMADALDQIVHAWHFKPAHLSTILRENFGPGEGGTGAYPAARPTHTSIPTTITSPTSPTSATSGTGSGLRSGTVPPIALPHPQSTGQVAGGGAEGAAAAALVLSRPVWRRGSFWVVALLCAAGVGVGVGVAPRGVGGVGASDPGLGTASAPAPAPKRVKRIPVLVQSEPEGADVYVPGKFEAVGTTPVWLNLEADKDVPARVMIRKSGYQDKAVAIETDHPPVVQLIETGTAADGVDSDEEKVAAARRTAARRHAFIKKHKESDAPVDSATSDER